MSLPLEFHAVTVFIFYWYFFTGMMVCPEHCILHFGGNCPKGCTMGAETVVVLGGQCYSLAAKQLFHIHSLGGSAISLILWRRYCESCTDQLVCYCLWLAPLYKCHLMSSHSNAVIMSWSWNQDMRPPNHGNATVYPPWMQMQMDPCCQR